MKRFRSRLGAWWLLLLLGRVFTPEAALLRLHGHQHTVDACSQPSVRKPGSTPAAFSAAHHHCHEEQLYNLPFQPAASPVVPLPQRAVRYPAYRSLVAECPARHLLRGAALRGPPVG